ncbi:MAG: DUF3830 domain-containing protein [Chloroflexi bacterium]|nr:MAG: DUF3830 domain-containing protein [Chloroflexota bacterium]
MIGVRWVTTVLRIQVGPFRFRARLEEERSPQTCRAFLAVLPFRSRLIQARWSGESAWVPLGDYSIGVGPENPIHAPQPGEILFYPAGISETEILFPYGETRFASKFGPLAGNHFLTIIDGAEQLPELGALVLRDGAQEIVFELD